MMMMAYPSVTHCHHQNGARRLPRHAKPKNENDGWKPGWQEEVIIFSGKGKGYIKKIIERLLGNRTQVIKV
jgi:hypothetical protein